MEPSRIPEQKKSAMSIWTSKLAPILAVLSLAACEGGLGVTRQAPEQIILPGSLTVGGAPGYCIDEAATVQGDDAAFVLLGSCASIAHNANAPKPDVPGIVTVSVGESGETAPDPAILERFVTSTAGRAALSRDGKAKSLRILETRRTGETLYLRADDQSQKGPSGLTTDYWRALLDVNGHFVTVSVLGFKSRPMPRSAALRTLREQVSRLKRENQS